MVLWLQSAEIEELVASSPCVYAFTLRAEQTDGFSSRSLTKHTLTHTAHSGRGRERERERMREKAVSDITALLQK